MARCTGRKDSRRSMIVGWIDHCKKTSIWVQITAETVRKCEHACRVSRNVGQTYVLHWNILIRVKLTTGDFWPINSAGNALNRRISKLKGQKSTKGSTWQLKSLPVSMGITYSTCAVNGRFDTILYRLQNGARSDRQGRSPSPDNVQLFILGRRSLPNLKFKRQSWVLPNLQRLIGPERNDVYVAPPIVQIFMNYNWSEESPEYGPAHHEQHTVIGQVATCPHIPRRFCQLLNVGRRATGPCMDCTHSINESRRINDTEPMLILGVEYRICKPHNSAWQTWYTEKCDQHDPCPIFP